MNRSRAKKVRAKESQEDEKKYLKEVFEANGHPPALVQKNLSKRSRRWDPDDNICEIKQDILCLPYIRGLSEEIENVTKDVHIRAIFKSQRTPKELL